MASGSGRRHSTSAIASTAEPSASTEPTDRSMPPAISTSVIPTVMTVSAGIWLASVVKVEAGQEVIGRHPEERDQDGEDADQAEVLGGGATRALIAPPWRSVPP